MANTYLFGASGHGKVIKEILNANGVKVEAFIDDNLAVDECADRKVLHEYDGLSPVIVSIGVNRIRKIVVEKLEAKAIANGNELEFTTAIHPTAIVSPTAKIGKGTVIMAGDVKINPNDKLQLDKSLRSKREDFSFVVPSYEQQVKEMREWVDAHPSLYTHYNVK